MSGARFGYWIGDTALLALALYRLALDRLVAKGFVAVLPPVLVREEALIGTGAFPSDEANVYEIAGRRPLPRRHGGDPARRPARGRDPGGRRAAASLRRLLAVLPPRGRRGRPRHPRDDPRPPVQQGRAVLVHATGGLVGRARAAAREHRGARAGARAALPRRRAPGRRHLERRREDVRRRDLVPEPGPLPRDGVDLEHDRLPGPAARDPATAASTAPSRCTR